MDLASQELTMLRNDKLSGYNYRERRHDEWNENYTMYRDKVIIDRLIQRQTVNIPLMKQTIRTLLKDVDDMPVLYFESIDNDKQAEMFKNEYWKYIASEECNRMEVQDIVDKRQVFLFGRSFDQWQIVDGKVKQTIQDPMDMYVDRYTDPTNLNTSRFLIHTHIFRPIVTLRDNPNYDQEAVKRLIAWYQSSNGLVKVAQNTRMLVDKNKKMRDMGVDDIDNPILGEGYIELTMHFRFHKDPGQSEEQIYLYVEAEDQEILMKKPLEEVIGVTKDHYWRTHYPYVTWADDVERQDFWSDGIGDIVRPANKVLNAWFSQLVENRTLRNFGMHYYDATIEGFTPGSFNPIPWGWYPVPGKPQDVMQKVDIPDLSESLDEMEFLLTVMEKATGATATQQGVQSNRAITLGEVQLALGEAKERIKGMSKFYTPAWKQRGEIFIKLLEAGSDKIDAVQIYKKGKNTSNLYTREISPRDWMTKNGYVCRVWSQEEKNTNDTNALQKLNLAKSTMPMNRKLNEVYQRKVLEFADLTPEETNAIMEEEQRKMDMLANQPQMGQMGQMGAPQPQPTPMLPSPQPAQRPAQQPRNMNGNMTGTPTGPMRPAGYA